MLNNLTNFLNLIANRKIKTAATIADSDLIPLGTRDPNYIGGYQPTAIEFSELKDSILNGVSLEGCLPQFSFKEGSVGPKVSFSKASGADPNVFKDVIIPGQLEITRGNGGGGIYNIAQEPSYNSGTSPVFTQWNTQYVDPTNTSWADLWDIENRTYNTWRNAIKTPSAGFAPPQYVGMHAVMRFWTGSEYRYWLIIFTEWGVGGYGEEGAFAYDRWEIFPAVEFTKNNYDNSAVDIISDGVHLTRANNEALYNKVTESYFEVYAAPRNTRWNSSYTDSRAGYYGFNDLSNLESRVYTDFVSALDYNVGVHILNTDLIMHDLTTDLYYKFTFSFWQGGNNGGGFTYTRTVIPQSCGIKFADGSVMNTAVSGSGGGGSVNYANVLFVDSTNGVGSPAQNDFTKPWSEPVSAMIDALSLTPTATNRTLIYIRRGEYVYQNIVMQNYTDYYCEPGVVFIDSCVYDNVQTVDTKFLGKAVFTGYGYATGGLIYRSNGPASKVVFEFDEINCTCAALEITNGASAVINGRRVFGAGLNKGFASTFRQGGTIELNLTEGIFGNYAVILTRYFSGTLTVNTPIVKLESGNPYGYGGGYLMCLYILDGAGGRVTVNGNLVVNSTDNYYGSISGAISYWTSGNNVVTINGNVFAENQFGVYGRGSNTGSKLIINGSLISNHLGAYIANNQTVQIKNGTLINKGTVAGSENYPILSLGGNAKYFIDNCQMYSEQLGATYPLVSAFWKDTTTAEINVYNTTYSAADTTGFFIRNSAGGQPVNNVRIHNCRSTKPLDTNITDILTPTGFVQDANILSINFI